jgi:Ca2+-binding EF-hand superfamily protein
MQKFGFFVLISVLSFSGLSGCGNDQSITMPVENFVPQQSVTVQSNQGLKSFTDYLVKDTFNISDENNDGFLTLQELLPNEYGQDTAKTFARLDKNRDSRLSFSEVKQNPKEFLGRNAADFRKTAKENFVLHDKDKNNLISRDEFINYSPDLTGELKTKQIALFLTGDKNRNGTLTFSEYEDLSYNLTQAWYSNLSPMPNPVPVVSSTPEPWYDEPGPLPPEPGTDNQQPN